MTKRNRDADSAGDQNRPKTGAAGQSGDLQGLESEPQADSESVDELLEEGQAFEAAVIAGVEKASDAGIAPVTTKQVPEDDVPQEYLEDDQV